LLLLPGLAFAITRAVTKAILKRPLRRFGAFASFFGTWAVLATLVGGSWATKAASAAVGGLAGIAVVLVELRGSTNRRQTVRPHENDPDFAVWRTERARRAGGLGEAGAEGSGGFHPATVTEPRASHHPELRGVIAREPRYRALTLTNVLLAAIAVLLAAVLWVGWDIRTRLHTFPTAGEIEALKFKNPTAHRARLNDRLHVESGIAMPDSIEVRSSTPLEVEVANLTPIEVKVSNNMRGVRRQKKQ